jgi:hypothetical protein
MCHEDAQRALVEGLVVGGCLAFALYVGLVVVEASYHLGWYTGYASGQYGSSPSPTQVKSDGG